MLSCHAECFVFCSYDVKIPVTSGFAILCIPDVTREVFQQHLNSFNDWSLVGKFMFSNMQENNMWLD